MHACGHDIHMAAWTGTARLMAEHRDRWRGTLVLVGQPAEEGLGGAAAMLKDGLFTRFPKPDFALSLHDDDTMPAGTIGYHPGLFRSMSDGVAIVVHGRGGHAAMPQNTVDPVVLAARGLYNDHAMPEVRRARVRRTPVCPAHVNVASGSSQCAVLRVDGVGGTQKLNGESRHRSLRRWRICR